MSRSTPVKPELSKTSVTPNNDLAFAERKFRYSDEVLRLVGLGAKRVILFASFRAFALCVHCDPRRCLNAVYVFREIFLEYFVRQL